jgi:hypothetical protein
MHRCFYGRHVRAKLRGVVAAIIGLHCARARSKDDIVTAIIVLQNTRVADSSRWAKAFPELSIQQRVP